MLFDRGSELPQATVRRAPRAWGDVLAGDLQRWVLARWVWLRPRLVPVAVALVGMVAVLQAVSYLSNPPAILPPAHDAATTPEAAAFETTTALPNTAGYVVRLVGE